MSAGDITLGVLGEVDPSVVSKFALGAQPVAFFELNLDDLLEAMPDSERQFTTLPRYPTATRDLALVVGGNVPSGSVQEIILRHRLVSRAELFDIYTGDQISDGTKSLAFHVYFQAQDRTLTNEEVDRALQGLLRNLEREVQASLRA
jgi:phenylalanyl-tRNA synthetase beta chain